MAVSFGRPLPGSPSQLHRARLRRHTRVSAPFMSGCSAVRLAHLLREQGVGGSNPPTPTIPLPASRTCLAGRSTLPHVPSNPKLGPRRSDGRRQDRVGLGVGGVHRRRHRLHRLPADLPGTGHRDCQTDSSAASRHPSSHGRPDQSRPSLHRRTLRHPRQGLGQSDPSPKPPGIAGWWLWVVPVCDDRRTLRGTAGESIPSCQVGSSPSEGRIRGFALRIASPRSGRRERDRAGRCSSIAPCPRVDPDRSTPTGGEMGV